MSKEEYIKEIIERLTSSNDMELIDLILTLLCKSV